jgi:hypothetical protein
MAVSDVDGSDDLEYTSFTPSGSTVETVRVTVDGVTVAVTVTGPTSNPVWDPKEAPSGGELAPTRGGLGSPRLVRQAGDLHQLVGKLPFCH